MPFLGEASRAPGPDAPAAHHAASSRLKVAFVAAFLVLGAAGMATVYSRRLNYPPIRSDGFGYYLYLPAAFIHHDLTLRASARDLFDGELPTWTGATRQGPNGEYLLQFTMGVAIMELPFFALAYGIAAPQGLHKHGFAMPFQYSIASAGLVYSALGMWLLWGLLERRFRRGSVLVAMVGVTYGTNLFHYSTYDSTFSHAFSFFLFAAFLVAIERLYGHPSWGRFLTVGLVAGLIVLVRPPNALWVLCAALYGLTSRAALSARIRFAREHWRKLAAAASAAAALLALQAGYWLYITGRPVVFPYARDWFDFANPHFFGVLFSVRKGLFFWSPVLLLACAGLPLLWRRAPEFVAPLALYLPAHAYVVASWSDWSYGGSFGHRAFTEVAPAFALGLAALCEARRGKAWFRSVAAATAVLTAWSCWLMIQYWLGTIPYDGATWSQVAAAFGL